jgi:MFS family permease
MHGRGPIVAAFAIHAAVFASIGARMPAIRQQAGLDDPALGLALGGFALGMLLGTRIAGPPVRRYGSRLVIRIGTPLLCLALTTVGFAGDLPSLTASLALFGMLGGCLDVAMNVHTVELERRMGRPIMSGVHGAWSAGMLASATIAWVAVYAGLPLAAHYTALGLGLAIVAWPILGWMEDLRSTTLGAAGLTPRRRRALLVPILALGLIAFAAYLTEGASGDWSAIYLGDVVGADRTTATFAFVAFALGMTVSRLVADRLAFRFGPEPVVRVAGLLAAGALAAGIALPTPAIAIAAFGIVGVALGPVVPTAFSAAGNSGAADGPVLGWVVTIGYMATIVGPMIMGFVSGLASLRVAFLLPLALALTIAAFAPVVRLAARGPSQELLPDPSPSRS